VSFAFILTVAVALALGVLLWWHIWMISRGETTIEFHHNVALRRVAAAQHEVRACCAVLAAWQPPGSAAPEV
jgi:hypothetical protein